MNLLFDILSSDGLVAGVGRIQGAQGQADDPAHQGRDHCSSVLTLTNTGSGDKYAILTAENITSHQCCGSMTFLDGSGSADPCL
jgi:hypothetical protein